MPALCTASAVSRPLKRSDRAHASRPGRLVLERPEAHDDRAYSGDLKCAAQPKSLRPPAISPRPVRRRTGLPTRHPAGHEATSSAVRNGRCPGPNGVGRGWRREGQTRNQEGIVGRDRSPRTCAHQAADAAGAGRAGPRNRVEEKTLGRQVPDATAARLVRATARLLAAGRSAPRRSPSLRRPRSPGG